MNNKQIQTLIYTLAFGSDNLLFQWNKGIPQEIEVTFIDYDTYISYGDLSTK